jgi:transposase
MRTFSAMTEDLLQMKDWLQSLSITHLAIESTGVYWKPIYNLLEGKFELLVVNAYHIKNVPGKKTDMKDAEWIADLLRHGLVRGSFVPNRDQRELRELLRLRKNLGYQRSQAVNRIQKTLEGGNIKLSNVASDVMGASGRAMLEAMIAGETDPEKLAGLAQGKLRKKRGSLEQALTGLVQEHQQFVLDSLLRQIDFLEAEISRLDKEAKRRMRPFEAEIKLLIQIPGIGQQTAEAILAEIGTDMKRFLSAAHLASWAKVCPGNNESAGKRHSGRTGHGNPWLSSALVQASWAAVRNKNNYFHAQFCRLVGRLGTKKAILAVAHAILVTIYHMLFNHTDYKDLGVDYFEKGDKLRIIRRAVSRIEHLGYKVALEPQELVFS